MGNYLFVTYGAKVAKHEQGRSTGKIEQKPVEEFKAGRVRMPPDFAKKESADLREKPLSPTVVLERAREVMNGIIEENQDGGAESRLSTRDMRERLYGVARGLYAACDTVAAMTDRECEVLGDEWRVLEGYSTAAAMINDQFGGQIERYQGVVDAFFEEMLGQSVVRLNDGFGELVPEWVAGEIRKNRESLEIDGEQVVVELSSRHVLDVLQQGLDVTEESLAELGFEHPIYGAQWNEVNVVPGRSDGKTRRIRGYLTTGVIRFLKHVLEYKMGAGRWHNPTVFPIDAYPVAVLVEESGDQGRKLVWDNGFEPDQVTGLIVHAANKQRLELELERAGAEVSVVSFEGLWAVDLAKKQLMDSELRNTLEESNGFGGRVDLGVLAETMVYAFHGRRPKGWGGIFVRDLKDFLGEQWRWGGGGMLVEKEFENLPKFLAERVLWQHVLSEIENNAVQSRSVIVPERRAMNIVRERKKKLEDLVTVDRDKYPDIGGRKAFYYRDENSMLWDHHVLRFGDVEVEDE